MTMVKSDPESRDPGADDTVATAFAHPAFSALKQQGAPSIIVAASPFRVIWANDVALELFGAADHRGLGARLSGSAGGLAQRLTHLSARLDHAAAPRLERLRFVQSLSSRTITALCQRIARPDGADALAVAVLGFEQGAGTDGLSVWRASSAEAEGRHAADACPLEAAAPPVPVTVQALLKGGAEMPEARDALRAALGGQDKGRFVWRTDAAGTVVQADVEALRALEAPVIPLVGADLPGMVRRFDEAGAGSLTSALASPRTWHGVEVLWPVASGAIALPIVLRASPWFEAGRGFAGFKGFGTFDLASIRPRFDGPLHRDDDARAAGGDALPDAQAEEVTPPPHVPDAPSDAAPPDTGLYASPANVVRLWPVMLPRPAVPVVERLLEPPPLPSLVENDGIEPPALQPGPEAFEPLALAVPAGLLTSSEHDAFAEIGRTLAARAAGPGPGEITAAEPEPAAEPVTPDSGPAPAAVPNDDLSRKAAALVETTTAGLLVVRGRMLLFANQALLDILHYQTHADFEVAVGGALAQRAPLGSHDETAALSLPTHDGREIRFAVDLRPIDWTGGGAQLLTLRAAEPKPEPAPAAAVSPAVAPEARALLDATGDAVALIDGTGGVLMLNQQGERWFGRDRHRLAGESFTLLLAPESRAAAAAMLNDVRAPQGSAEARRDVAARSADGPLLALDMRLARIAEDRFSVVWRDLSALKQSERDFARARSDAERASDRQPELLAKLSHQIRTPLNAIIGFAEIMMDERFGTLGNPRYKDYLKDIHTSGTQVMNVVNDLLDLSRIEAGRHELDLGAVDINRVIGECVTQMQAEAHRGRVIVRTSFSPRQPMVLADDRATRQIISNLLSNAVKFNEPGGQVIVSTTTGETGLALVRIRDTGIGMSDRDIASALEPFRQLAPSRQAEGTGLGLPLTKALVGANGASLSIRSRPGEGTMVEVTFQPAATPARVPA